jgi:acyl-CoA synthetase (AMP-forming)/AMP-acid ligase II
VVGRIGRPPCNGLRAGAMLAVRQPSGAAMDSGGLRVGVPMLCAAFALGAPWTLWVARSDYRAATAAWNALAAAPSAEDRVAGRHSGEPGAGRSRRRHDFLTLVPGGDDGTAASAVVVEVAAASFGATPVGSRWRARLAGAQPAFDPLQARPAQQPSGSASIATLILLPLGLLLLWLHRSGRLYRQWRPDCGRHPARRPAGRGASPAAPPQRDPQPPLGYRGKHRRPAVPGQEPGMAIIYRSPLALPAIPEVGVHALVLADAAARGDRPALVDGLSGETVGYAALAAGVERLRGGLAALGIGRGDTVAIMAPNCPAYALVFHAVVGLGAVLTTVNPLSAEPEVRAQLADAGARTLCTTLAFLPLAQALQAAGVVDRLVLLDGAAPAPARGIAQLLQAPPQAAAAVDPGALAVLPYSSGTTGLPKGVMLSHRNLVANLLQVATHFDWGDDEVVLAVLPFFHIYGMQVVMNDGLRRGATLVTLPRFDLEQYLALIPRYRVTRLYVVPPIVLALAKHPRVAEFDLSSLRSVLSGAAPLDAALSRAAAARIGVPVVQGYGMTELSPVSHSCRYADPRPGSIGILVAGAEGRVVDPASGADCPPGVDGEIRVRGPMVMQGYLNNPAATAATVDAEGWLRTGDIGHVDADGYWYVVDRLKELIKVKGFQVAPARLEALLLTHAAVADAAVIGVPDEEAGERPKAFVVRRPGAEVAAEELQAHVAASVAGYERIAELVFVDSIPKSPSGKILRRLLRGA